jgi:hypothetical protein
MEYPPPKDLVQDIANKLLEERGQKPVSKY